MTIPQNQAPPPQQTQQNQTSSHRSSQQTRTIRSTRRASSETTPPPIQNQANVNYITNDMSLQPIKTHNDDVSVKFYT